MADPAQETPATEADAGSDLGWTKDLDLPFDDARAQVEAQLKEHGFGVMSEIPVHAKLEEKLGVTDFPRYEILGACNPPLAHEALQRNRNVGLLMPCNVTLEQVDEGTTRVSIVDPDELLSTRFQDDATLCALAEGAAQELRGAFDAL